MPKYAQLSTNPTSKIFLNTTTSCHVSPLQKQYYSRGSYWLNIGGGITPDAINVWLEIIFLFQYHNSTNFLLRPFHFDHVDARPINGKIVGRSCLFPNLPVLANKITPTILMHHALDPYSSISILILLLSISSLFLTRSAR